MRFVVGCNLEEFKRYYRTLDGLHNYFKTLGITDARFGELGPTEEGIVKRNPSYLIVWRENDETIGHAIWHEASTDEFGDPRDKEVREVLERLLGGKREFVELHEVWLKEKHRGKGYGKKFFELFEDFIRKRGDDSIVYYTGHPAAIAICRKRGYKEDFLTKEKWYVFYLLLNKTPSTSP
jgi:GNAT superfamily N-acetyltransferase